MFNFGIGATRKSTKKKPCIQPNAVYKSSAANSVKKAAPKAKKATTRKPSVAKSVMVVSEPAKGLNVAIVADAAPADAKRKGGLKKSAYSFPKNLAESKKRGIVTASQNRRAKTGEWLTYNTPLQNKCSKAGDEWRQGSKRAASVLAMCKWKGFDAKGLPRVLSRGIRKPKAKK